MTIPLSIDDPRLPPALTVDYTLRDFEVVDYDNYILDTLPRIRFRGPRFDPRCAAPGSFFTAFGSAHTLGVLASTTYSQLLSQEIGLNGWNVGVGGISASFYNKHPQIIDYANRGRFAIVQIPAARMESNDRLQSTPSAQMVLDTVRGDVIVPELGWRRIAEEEPENQERYVEQSRQSWVAEHRKLLSALKVPVVLLWFSSRPLCETGESLGQIGKLTTTSFPQLINQKDVDQIRDLASNLVECVTSRGTNFKLISRFTGNPVRINYRMMGPHGGNVDYFEDSNLYYAPREMQEDAAAALVPQIRQLMIGE